METLYKIAKTVLGLILSILLLFTVGIGSNVIEFYDDINKQRQLTPALIAEHGFQYLADKFKVLKRIVVH